MLNIFNLFLGGEVYLFQPTDKGEAKDWRSDGHRWYNNTRMDMPKRNPVVTKVYFYLETEQGINKEFRKQVFFKINSSLGPFLLHYIGDEQVSVPRSHGNSLIQTKLFFRTRPSVMEKLKQKSQEKEPSRLYKEEIASIDETDTAGEILHKPRNKKQLENIRSGIKNESRLSRDAVLNAHEIAYELTDYVHYFATVPYLVVVVGLKEIFEELETLLLTKDKNQLLSYDTTFQLGPYYVSVLLFRHVMFNEHPVMPAAFLIHEAKWQDIHAILFSILRQNVKGLTNNVPIATDEENAIVNAIAEKTSLFRVGCVGHLRSNIKEWVDSHQGTKEDRGFYVGEVMDLIQSEKKRIQTVDTNNEHWSKWKWSSLVCIFYIRG